MHYDIWMAFLLLTSLRTLQYHTKTEKQAHYSDDFYVKDKFLISKQFFLRIIAASNNGKNNGKEEIKEQI